MGINLGAEVETGWSEQLPISDIYCDGIAAVENLGSNFRTVYFVYQRAPSGLIERVCVAKLVRPVESLLSVPGGGLAKMLNRTPLLGRLELDDSKGGH